MIIRSRWRYKYDFLIGKGFLAFEAREISRQYTMTQIRRLPYLKALINSRMLFVNNLRKKGYSIREIRDRVYALYDTKDWLTDGRPDIWQMLRKYRKTVIDSGGTASPGLPPKRKGSHHKGGISKGDLQGQRQRRRAKTKVQQRDDLNQEIIRAIGSGNQELRRKLEAKRNRLYGY